MLPQPISYCSVIFGKSLPLCASMSSPEKRGLLQSYLRATLGI